MKKYFEAEIRNSVISGNLQTSSDEFSDRSNRRGQSYMKVFGFSTLKFFYVLVTLCGLGGVIISIIKIILLSAISGFDMVLLFGVACISIGGICAGISGLFRMKTVSKDNNLNITNTTFAD